MKTQQSLNLSSGKDRFDEDLKIWVSSHCR